VVFGPALLNALRAVAGSAATAAPVGWSSRVAALEGCVFAVVVVLATVLRWLPKVAPDLTGRLGLRRPSMPGGIAAAAAAYVGIAVASGWLGERVVAGLKLPHAGYPAAGSGTGGFVVDAGASAAAGLTEEITLLALAVAVLDQGWRVRGRRPAWATPATIGVLLLLRWPLHLYYVWGSLFVLFWIPAAYALYRWIGSVWPLVLGHAGYDCLLSAEHAYPELAPVIDWLLWLIAILGAAAIAVGAAARRADGSGFPVGWPVFARRTEHLAGERVRAMAVDRADAISEPLPREPFDHLGKRGGAGRVQIATAPTDDREDLGEGRAFGEIGVHPHRHLDQRVRHRDHPAPEGSCG
jgi:hypothetical protein